MLVYPYRLTKRVTKSRPADELRAELRNGGEAQWAERPLGRDIAGVDATVILLVDLQNDMIFGIDAQLYDPIPLGISAYVKDAQVNEVRATGWYVWEKEVRPGQRRDARSPSNLETIVGFRPDRIIDYVRLERRAALLGLDTPLRFAAAALIGAGNGGEPVRHVLEQEFDLSSQQILDVIRNAKRLSVAVRGGVAEIHLETLLNASSDVARVVPIDEDGRHDFDVTLTTGEFFRVECKNASPKQYANGDYKVELQKTRDPKGEPGGRLYSADAFDVTAACLFSATGRWEFRFALTASLPRDEHHPDKLAAMQHVDSNWAMRLSDLVRRPLAVGPGVDSVTT